MTSPSPEIEPMDKRRLLPWTIIASFMLHGVAYASLAGAPQPAKPEHRKTLVRFEVSAPPKPAEAPPPPPPQPEPPQPKARAAAPKAAAQPEPPPPSAAEPPPSEGVTLAGDGAGNAFSMPLGNGGSLEPTRPRVVTPAPPAPAPAAPSVLARVLEPALVAVGDLSARPSPPALGAALERNYPADARQRGLSGTAKVRARIDPDGTVRRVALIEESAPGFGVACSRALTGSRWAAPKDKAGRSVATEIRYTCRFVVHP